MPAICARFDDQHAVSEEARAGVERIAAAYGRQGASANFVCAIERETGHVLSGAMWTRAREWFAKHLK